LQAGIYNMTITVGVHAKAESNNAASVTTGSLTTQASGSLFAMVVEGQGTIGNSDSKTNTWTTQGSQPFNGANGKGSLFFVQNATGGAGNTFTGTQSGGAGPWLVMAEFLGAAISGGPNAFSSSNPSGGVTTVAAPSVVTTVANCLILTCIMGASNVLVTPSSLNGTVLDALSTNADGIAGAFSWFLAGAPGTYSDTFTFAGQTFFDMAAYTIAFAPAGGNTATIGWTV
jgi:hypothetical protein